MPTKAFTRLPPPVPATATAKALNDLNKRFVDLTTTPKPKQLQSTANIEASSQDNTSSSNKKAIASNSSANIAKEKPKKTSLQQASASQSLITPPKHKQQQQLPQYLSASTLSKMPYAATNETKNTQTTTPTTNVNKHNAKIENSSEKLESHFVGSPPKILDNNNTNINASILKSNKVLTTNTNANLYAHHPNSTNHTSNSTQPPLLPQPQPQPQPPPTVYTNINPNYHSHNNYVGGGNGADGHNTVFYPSPMLPTPQGQYYPNQMQSNYNPYMMPYQYQQQPMPSIAQHHHQQSQQNFQYFY
jgi:hypothetical protein